MKPMTRILSAIIDKDYIIRLRRQLHMYPETNFDLPRTTALVKQELESLRIPYTEDYGQGSVVGYINPHKKQFIIGLRADMDALDILEKNDVSYRSRIDGKMHACGHDAHTAMLLGAAKALKAREEQLDCCVKLLFQPSEEGLRSGAAMMIENGVMEDVDVIVGQHVDNDLETGVLGICPGYAAASSRHITIEILGRSAHAASAHTGVDALAIAMRMYNAIQLVASREISPKENFVCSICSMEAGTSHNIVAGRAVMKGTIRAFHMDVSAYIFGRIEKIAKCLEEETGAQIKVTGPVKSVCVYNNPYVSELLMDSMRKIMGTENTVLVSRRFGSEDFSRYGEIKPAVFFRLGTRNEAKGCTASAHHDDFSIDEDALEIGCSTLVQFVLDHQHGIDTAKANAADERKREK